MTDEWPEREDASSDREQRERESCESGVTKYEEERAGEEDERGALAERLQDDQLEDREAT